jgi:hypothetical protein
MKVHQASNLDCPVVDEDRWINTYGHDESGSLTEEPLLLPAFLYSMHRKKRCTDIDMTLFFKGEILECD